MEKILNDENKNVIDRKNFDEKFFRDLQITAYKEFKNRDPSFAKHEMSDKIILFDKIEKTFHQKLDAKHLLGPNLMK